MIVIFFFPYLGEFIVKGFGDTNKLLFFLLDSSADSDLIGAVFSSIKVIFLLNQQLKTYSVHLESRKLNEDNVQLFSWTESL